MFQKTTIFHASVLNLFNGQFNVNNVKLNVSNYKYT